MIRSTMPDLPSHDGPAYDDERTAVLAEALAGAIRQGQRTRTKWLLYSIRKRLRAARAEGLRNAKRSEGPC